MPARTVCALRRTLWALSLAMLVELAGCAAQPPAAPIPRAASTSSISGPTGAEGAARGEPAGGGAATAPASPAVPPEPTLVRMGVLGVLADLPVYLADQRGYLREQGLTLQTEQFRSGAEMFPALATGQLQAGWTAPTAALFNAYAADVDVPIVASYGRTDRDRNNVIFVVGGGSAVQDPRDLQGRTIAINSRATISYLYADRALRRAGLTLGDVAIEELPFPDMPPALASGKIDAAQLIDPFATMLILSGAARPLARGYDVAGEHDPGMLQFAPDFARQRAVATRYLKALLLAGRDYATGLVYGQEPLRQEVLGVLRDQFRIQNDALLDQLGFTGPNPNGRVSLNGLRESQDFFVAQGLVSRPVVIERMVDNSFVDAVLADIGEYQPPR
ncbi:MAG TPA: ABC transporter substrate-binding protein [Chloroflexota bacterium]|nr:ABC transporter substrate-binding protein [Chloroflexota bacterium]